MASLGRAFNVVGIGSAKLIRCEGHTPQRRRTFVRPAATGGGVPRRPLFQSVLSSYSDPERLPLVNQEDN